MGLRAAICWPGHVLQHPGPVLQRMPALAGPLTARASRRRAIPPLLRTRRSGRSTLRDWARPRAPWLLQTAVRCLLATLEVRQPPEGLPRALGHQHGWRWLIHGLPSAPGAASCTLSTVTPRWLAMRWRGEDVALAAAETRRGTTSYPYLESSRRGSPASTRRLLPVRIAGSSCSQAH